MMNFSGSSKRRESSTSAPQPFDEEDFEHLSTSCCCDCSAMIPLMGNDLKICKEIVYSLERKLEKTEAFLAIICDKIDKEPHLLPNYTIDALQQKLEFENHQRAEVEEENVLIFELTPSAEMEDLKKDKKRHQKAEEEEEENNVLVFELAPSMEMEELKKDDRNIVLNLENFQEEDNHPLVEISPSQQLEKVDFCCETFNNNASRFVMNKGKEVGQSETKLFVASATIEPTKFGFCQLIPNKWSRIDSEWSCCAANCLGANRMRGFCRKGNGIVRLRDGNAKYLRSTTLNGLNRSLRIYAERGFSHLSENCLYYFEVTVKPETDEKCGWALEMGLFKSSDCQFRVCSNGLLCCSTTTPKTNSTTKNSTNNFSSSSSSFTPVNRCCSLLKCSLVANDVLGCGLHFLPNANDDSSSNNKPVSAQLFFTLNGERRGKTILLDDCNGNFYPIISLFCCSVEANFGLLPFRYNVGKN